MAFERSIHAKVLLEGIPVQFESVSISESINNNTPSAEISLAPTESIKKIKPRTLVHVLVKRTVGDGFEDEYKCVFEGEVGAYVHRKVKGQKSFVIVAYGLGNYWDYIKLYYFETNVSGTLQTTSASAVERMQQAIENQPKGNSVSVIVNRNTKSFEVLDSDIYKAFSNAGNSFAQGLKNLFDLAFKEQEGSNGKYQFALDAEERLRLIDRIVVSAADVGKFIDRRELNSYIAQLPAAEGPMINFARVLQYVLAAVYHEYSCPAAPVRFGGHQQENGRDLIRSVMANESGAREALLASSGLRTVVVPGSYVFKPNCFFTAPPGCNVFFPAAYGSFSFSRNFFSEPTRLYYLPEPPRLNYASESEIAEAVVYAEPVIAPIDKFKTSDLVTGRDDAGNTTVITLESALDRARVIGIEYSYLTEQELEEGCNPITGQWPRLATALNDPQSEALGSSGTLQVTPELRYQNIADYQFWLQYYSVGRVQTIRSEYRPGIMVGFPAVVLDSGRAKFHTIGYVQSCGHVITPTGECSTDVTISLCREYTEPSPKFSSGSRLPPWYDSETFSDENIGTRFYSEVIGTDVTVASYGSGDDLLTSGIDELYKKYVESKASDERYANRVFMDSVTERPLVTESEVFGYIGAKDGANGSWYSEDGKPFRKSRADIIKAHNDELTDLAEEA